MHSVATFKIIFGILIIIHGLLSYYYVRTFRFLLKKEMKPNKKQKHFLDFIFVSDYFWLFYLMLFSRFLGIDIIKIFNSEKASDRAVVIALCLFIFFGTPLMTKRHLIQMKAAQELRPLEPKEEKTRFYLLLSTFFCFLLPLILFIFVEHERIQ